MERFEELPLSSINIVVLKLAELLPNYPCIALHGTMGSGKTTLTMAILKDLGITSTEGSPTFSIVQPYLLQNNQPLYHIDAFRLNSEEEALQLGMDELFEEDAYFIVEWPEIISNFLPRHRIDLTIENTLANNRTYTLEYGH